MDDSLVKVPHFYCLPKKSFFRPRGGQKHHGCQRNRNKTKSRLWHPNDFIRQLPSRCCEFAELTVREPILHVSDLFWQIFNILVMHYLCRVRSSSGPCYYWRFLLPYLALIINLVQFNFNLWDQNFKNQTLKSRIFDFQILFHLICSSGPGCPRIS